MLAYAGITAAHYALFIAAVILFLALDLGLFNRKAHRISFKEALGWTALWFSMAMAFAFFIVPAELPNGIEPHPRMAFLTGYVLELSLSMDNVFVIALIFTYFRVEHKYQHRVLFWGILGAIIMRGLMIGIGAAAVAKWEGILYLFGAFLLFTGIKMLFADNDEGVEPEGNILVKIARRIFPVHDQFEGERFTIVRDGKRMLTPMAIVLITVESTDVVFAVDSIPAIFSVTKDPFIVFTSNMFAILGLRSLYFVLAGAIEYFHYLKYGLALVLAFIGAKMLGQHWLEERFGAIPHWVALAVVAVIILISIIASIIHKLRAQGSNQDGSD
jgi:tellurite resistance protein TerC